MTEERGVLGTLDTFLAAATESRDADQALRCWAGDGDVAMWGSDLPERADGPAELRALIASIAATHSSLAFTWASRTVHVEGDVAWVNAAGELDISGRTIPYRLTAVLVRRDAQWLLHTFNGSEPHV
jgi:ketosteroid isomerase-like protein